MGTSAAIAAYALQASIALGAASAQAVPVVAIDPGHGGRYNGSAWSGPGESMLEKDVNLDVSLRLATLLREAGLEAVLTRDADTELNTGLEDLNQTGRVDEDDDLQARVDVANQAGAAIFLSVHHNGGPPAARGTSTFYCQDHPRGAEARLLAELVQAALLEGLRGLGYTPLDMGALDDAPLRKPYGHLFLAGPETPRVARASAMPTIVGEPLFLSNPTEAELLRLDDTRQALAEAYFRASVQFLEAVGMIPTAVP